MYAEWNNILDPTQIQYDTIDILTLPAFDWISVPYKPQNPRHDHSCNAVDDSQILSIEGTNTNLKKATDNDSADNTTFYSNSDPFLQGLAIFDMTSLEFLSQYTAEAQSYEQSHLMKQFYSLSQQ